MAHIKYTLSPHFTGHVGPVRFKDGHADCDDPELLDFFKGQPDLYDVDDPDDVPDFGPDPQE